MTITLKCDWCGKDFERAHNKGPIPRFCSRGHRQRSYEARTVGVQFSKALSDVPALLLRYPNLPTNFRSLTVKAYEGDLRMNAAMGGIPEFTQAATIMAKAASAHFDAARGIDISRVSAMTRSMDVSAVHSATKIVNAVWMDLERTAKINDAFAKSFPAPEHLSKLMAYANPLISVAQSTLGNKLRANSLLVDQMVAAAHTDKLLRAATLAVGSMRTDLDRAYKVNSSLMMTVAAGVDMKRLTDEVVGNFNFGKITAATMSGEQFQTQLSRSFVHSIIEDYRPELHETTFSEAVVPTEEVDRTIGSSVLPVFPELDELEIGVDAWTGVITVVCVLSPILLATCWTQTKESLDTAYLFWEYAGWLMQHWPGMTTLLALLAVRNEIRNDSLD